MSQNRNDMESSKDIKLTLIVRKDEKGRSYYTGEYDPEDLKDLCIVLLTDDRLRRSQPSPWRRSSPGNRTRRRSSPTSAISRRPSVTAWLQTDNPILKTNTP